MSLDFHSVDSLNDRHSKTAGRPRRVVAVSRERVESRDEALLRDGGQLVRIRGEIEARIGRQWTARASLDLQESVAVVTIRLDRLLKRTQQQRRECLTVLLCRCLEAAELLEDALAVVGDAGDSSRRFVWRNRAAEPGAQCRAGFRVAPRLIARARSR